MTLQEFKAWFEGFTEDMDGEPNAKQWKRIKAKIKDINGTAVSYPVYIDRYVRPYIPSFTEWKFNHYPPIATYNNDSLTTGYSNVVKTIAAPSWQEVGKAEFKTISGEAS